MRTEEKDILAEYGDSAVAVIGMEIRLPGADCVEAFWKNLSQGTESIHHFTHDELRRAGVDEALINDPNYVASNGVIKGLENFDAQFFGYSPREAELLDPQQRLFLESAWAALETAGYDTQQYAGSVGIFAGSGRNFYAVNNLYPNRELVKAAGDYALMLGNDKDFLATRTAYKLNLKGPAISQQTACSTGLVAVHSAIQSLLNGECDIALAGAVSLRLPQEGGHLYEPGGIGSPDGHCRAFDKDAQGTVGGSGVAIVVLKRLEEALDEGDNIDAVIRGSAINNDGALKAGYTAPSIEGQSAVIREALSIAGVLPDDITYIEAHGTGTPLGDPIEIAALNNIFKQDAIRRNKVAIGSVKTNIGHLDTASGLAGLIKTVLSLKNKQLAPSLHYREANPNIDFVSGPFSVNTSLIPWNPEQRKPRIAGVSSFGIGGTNAHVVIQEAPVPTLREPIQRRSQLLVLSAKTESALTAVRLRLRTHLQENPEQSLCDIANTLQLGRRSFQYRNSLVCKDHEEAIEILAGHGDQQPIQSGQITANNPSKNCFFIFPGQGSQYPGMGHEIYVAEPIFRDAIDRGCRIYQQVTGEDLFGIMYPESADSDSAIERLKQTAYAQPALFIFEYALAQLWKHWGIEPQAMLGHSLGEYTAACLAEVITFEDAIRLVTKRGALIQALPAGGMLAVHASEQKIQTFLTADLSLAAVNAPEICTVSGTFEAVKTAEEKFDQADISYQRLETSHAFHSAMLNPILSDFTTFVESIELSVPTKPYVSSLTGDWITPEQATSPLYWTKQLSQPVRFSKSLKTLLNESNPLFIEVGPARTLSGLIPRNYDAAEHSEKPISLHSLTKPTGYASLQYALGQLWLNNVPINWGAYYAADNHTRVRLPSYPFESKRFWVDAISPNKSDDTTISRSTQKQPLSEWCYTLNWQRTFPNKTVNTEKLIGPCLLFVDKGATGDLLRAQLATSAHPTITVYPGDTYEQMAGEAFSINPAQPEHYSRLLKNLSDREIKPATVIHLWNYSETEALDTNADIRLKGIHSLVALTTALDQQNLIERVRFYLVSNNAYDVTGSEKLSPDKATLRGPLMAIPQEYPSCLCKHIDFASGEAPEIVVNQLIQEIGEVGENSTLAYRGPHRWSPSLQPIRLESNGQTGEPNQIKPNGIYLITGGLGGIGLAVAEDLGKRAQAKIILTSRSPFPAKATWDQPHPSPIQETIHQLQAIEKNGSEVLVTQTDITDLESFQATIAQAEEAWGAVDGIIHAAGSLPTGLISEKTYDSVEANLAPKNEAVCVLESLVTKTPLDFVVLMSSLSSWLGGLGGIDYAAANAALDTWGHQLSKNGTNTILINWDGWCDIGMAEKHLQDQGMNDERLALLRKMAISPAEGVEVFGQIMSAHYPQVFVSTHDLPNRIASRCSNSLSVSSTEDSSSGDRQYQRPSIDSKYVAPRTPTEKHIAKIWQSILGIDKAGIRDSYFDLGGDSLLLLRVQKELQRDIDKSITKTDLFEFPTIEVLAQFIDKKTAPSQSSEKASSSRQRDALKNTDQSDRLERRRQRKLS